MKMLRANRGCVGRTSIKVILPMGLGARLARWLLPFLELFYACFLPPPCNAETYWWLVGLSRECRDGL